MGVFEKKSDQAVVPELAEFDRQLAMLAQKKRETYFRIGQAYAKNTTLEMAEGTPYAADLQVIRNIEAEEILLEKRKLAAQGLRKCEKCGNILVLDSVFCNKCGEKLEPLFAKATVNQNVCSNCGAPYEEGASFCTSCGNKLV